MPWSDSLFHSIAVACRLFKIFLFLISKSDDPEMGGGNPLIVLWP